MRIYLDHNATTPLADEVAAAVTAAMRDCWGNPSSVHAEGRRARGALEAARHEVAALVGGDAEEIIFTSGGTEADALGLCGLAERARSAGRPARVLTLAIEHPAVRGAAALLAARGFAVRDVAVDSAGRIELGDLAAQLAGGVAVVALAAANHELGIMQPVAEAVAIAHERGALVHCDAVQLAGKHPMDVTALGVDALAVSAHKLYGPKGIGALWVRRGLDVPPLLPAGHQERERRPGTEAVAAIAGFGVAARLAREHAADDGKRITALTAALERGLVGLGAVVYGASAPRVGNTVLAGFPGALGEVVVQALDLHGVAASTGAACSSGTVAPSPVLLALGVEPARAVEVVRFSLGRGSSAAEVEHVLELLPAILERARAFR